MSSNDESGIPGTVDCMDAKNDTTRDFSGIDKWPFGEKDNLATRSPVRGSTIPALFIIAMDFLARYLQKLHQSGAIRLPVPAMRPCLLYADDALLFYKPDANQAQEIKIALTVFQQVSGLQINLNKSEALFSGVNQDSAAQISAILGCQQKNFPFVYLGIPLSDKRLLRSAYLPLLHRISKRLEGWAAKFLSMAGRLILINSTLSSLPIYFMTVLKLPQWVIQEIDKTRRKFLWHGAQEQQKGYNLVNWESVCEPKKIGGLGVLDLGRFNEALLLKWLWWWFQPEHRLCKPLFRETAAIEHGIPQALVFTLITGEIRNFFNVSTKWIPGDGTIIRLWEHNWGFGAIKISLPNLYTFSINTEITLAQAVAALENGIQHQFRQNISVEAQEELLQLCDYLQELHLDQTKKDEIFWNWTTSGSFTVNTAYNYLKEGPRIKMSISKLWKIKAPPRMKIFMWLASRNSVLTHDNLQKRGWELASICLLCKSAAETGKHLFEECTYTRKLYEQLRAHKPGQAWPQALTLEITDRTKTGTMSKAQKSALIICSL